eukprot:m.188135 g.188135  ORF g.188135 m.188135 type:complete len:149 (+) comp17302_c0_seq1:123-569(+)
MMNPTDQQIINDVGNLYAAAFDHGRPLKRETQFFLKSFESKNGVEAKEVLKATLDGTAPVVAKGLPEAIMAGKHLAQLTEQVTATEALVKGLCGAEIEWQGRHEQGRVERRDARNTELATMEAERQTAFDAIDRVAEQQIRDFNPNLQ